MKPSISEFISSQRNRLHLLLGHCLCPFQAARLSIELEKEEQTIRNKLHTPPTPMDKFTTMKISIAEEVSIHYPITAEDLLAHADYLPPMEEKDTRIAMSMLGILAAREGRSIREHPLAIKLGIARTGSATELANCCRIAAAADTIAKKAVAIDHLFGARHTASGTTLITPDFPILPTDH